MVCHWEVAASAAESPVEDWEEATQEAAGIDDAFVGEHAAKIS